MSGTPRGRERGRRLHVNIVTEAPGWIMHRQAVEAARVIAAAPGWTATVNDPRPDADINYFLNYGYFTGKSAALDVANFTHFDPDRLADRFVAAARAADHCTAVSHETARVLLGLGVDPSRITVIVSGFDTATYVPKLRLGLVGRVYPGGRKGERLIAGLLADARLMRDVEIVASAPGWGVPVEAVPLDRFYRSLDYLLVPSLIEGGPVPLLEALGCGVPALVSDIPANREWVTHEVNGRLFPDGDANALADALVRAVDERERLKALGRAGRRTAEARADWDANAKKLLEAYRLTVERKA